MGFGAGVLSRRRRPPAAQDNGAVGDFDDVVELVGDQDDGDTLLGKGLDQIEYLAFFANSQCLGGLVEQDDLLGERNRSGHGDGLGLPRFPDRWRWDSECRRCGTSHGCH